MHTDRYRASRGDRSAVQLVCARAADLAEVEISEYLICRERAGLREGADAIVANDLRSGIDRTESRQIQNSVCSRVKSKDQAANAMPAREIVEGSIARVSDVLGSEDVHFSAGPVQRVIPV